MCPAVPRTIGYDTRGPYRAAGDYHMLAPRAQLALEDLAGRVARQLGDERDPPRPLEVGQAGAAELDDLGLGDGVAVAHDDECVQRLAPLRVGHADHRGVDDRGVAVEEVLDLARVDVDAAGDHHVVLARLEVVVAVGVAPREGAGRGATPAPAG